MNILRFLFLAVLTLTFSLPSDAATSVEEQRAQAAQLLKKLESQAEKAEFAQIPAANTNKTLQEVADIYKKLLETVNDEHSGDDLENYLFSAIAASRYDHTIGDINKIFEIASASYPSHADNTSYLIDLWHMGHKNAQILPIFFPKYFPAAPPSRQPGRIAFPFPSDTGKIFSLLKLGETILQKGQGNVAPAAFGQFLMEYGNYWNNLPYSSYREERLAAYGYRHLLTPLDANPVTAPLFIYNRDNYAVLDKVGQPLIYGIPASWTAAKNDGERIHFLYNEAKRMNPALEPQIRLSQALALRDAFSPIPTVIDNRKIADLELIYEFVPANSSLRANYWDNKQEFFTLLATLAPNETLLPQGDQSLKIKLPKALDYIGELHALAQNEIQLSPAGGNEAIPAYYQLQTRNTAAQALTDEWINRLNYDKARETIAPLLVFLEKEKSLLQEERQKSSNNALYEKLNILQKQLSGKKAFFPGSNFPQSDSRFVSGDNVRIPLLYRNATHLNVSIHKIDTDYFLKKAAGLKKAGDDNYSHSFLDAFSFDRNPDISMLFLPHQGKPLSTPLVPQPPQTADYALSPQPQGKDTLDYITLPKLESGYYFVEGKTDGNDYTFGRIIYVGNLNMNEFPTTGNVTIHLTDYTSGTPIGGAKINVIALDVGEVKPDADNVQSRSFTAETDAMGLANLPLEGLQANQKRYFLVTAQKDGNFLYYLTSGGDRQRIKEILKKQNQATAALITDRKVYRPGQTVHWQAWVGNGNYQTGGKLLSDHPVTVEFSELAPRFEGKTDTNGIVSGSFIIPPTSRLSSYSISLNGENIRPSSTPFSVEDYKKPDFEVSITSGKETLLFGEDSAITVSAKYYSGEPVTQGTVTLNLSNNRYNPQAPGAFSLKKTLPLNSQGKATFDFKVPTPSGMENPVTTLQASATVADASLRQVEERNNFVVTTLPFSPAISTDAGFGRAGERMSATVDLKKYSGAPAAAQGEATLYFLPAGVKPPLKREKIVSWNIATNAEGKAQLSFVPPNGGFFLLETVFPVNPDKNSFASTEIIFPALPGKEEKTPLVTGIDTFKIYSEKQKYRPGEKAKLLLITPEGASRVELKTNLLYSNEKIYSIDTPTLFTECELPITIESAPSLLIRASALSNGLFFKEEHTIDIFTSAHKIDLSAQVSAKEDTAKVPANGIPAFSPREQANVKVKVTSPDGQPVTRTPVAISVYDKALEVFARRYGLDFNNHPFWTTYKEPLSWVTGFEYGRISSSDIKFQREIWNHDFVETNYTRSNAYREENSSIDSGNFLTNKERLSYDQKQEEILIPLMGQFAAWSHVTKDGSTLNANLNRSLSPGSVNNSTPGLREILAIPEQLSITACPRENLFNRYISFMDEDRDYLEHRLSSSPLTGGEFAPSMKIKTPSPIMGDSISSARLGPNALSMEMEENTDPFAASPPELRRAKSFGTPAQIQSQFIRSSQPPAPVVRKEFADLMKWNGSLITDENGIVELPLTMPDNLTTWKIKAWSVDKSLNSGQCTAEFVTTRDFIAQLQTTRFLVAQDKSLASAVIRNYTDIPQTIQVSLKIKGDSLSINTRSTPEVQGIVVPAKGTVTVNWEITALKEGNALLTLQALGEKVSDASEHSLPVTIRGAFNSQTLDLNLAPGETSASTEFTIPEDIKKEMTQAYVNVSPGMAPAILKALPYLSSYPYGCMEQTMNRFVPTVIVANTFRDLNIDVDKLLAQALPAPEGQNPLKNKAMLEKQIQDGITRLANAQGTNNWSSSRGWSWFAGGAEMDPYITAQIVHGLNLALGKDSPWRISMLEPAVNALAEYQKNREEVLGEIKHPTADATDVFVYYVLNEQKKASPKTLEYLLRDKKNYTPFTLTQLGMILQSQGEKKTLSSLLAALKSLVKTDKKTQTAWLDLPSSRDWWTWQNDLVETQASYLKLLTAVKPSDETARLLARWLVLNREHSFYWKSTRDTALVIESLCGYMKATGEGLKPLSLELLIDGKTVKTVTYDPDKLEEFSGDLILTADALPPGKHKLELRRQSGDGKTPVYLAVGVRYFSTAQKLKASGTDLTVSREYSRVATAKNATGEPVATTTPLKDGEELQSGDVLEVTLKVTAQNDYQYLILRDPKPAGCEPFNLISGYNNAFAGPIGPDGEPIASDPFRSDNTYFDMGGPGPVLPPALSYYTELADRETRVFMPALPRGEHYITYKLRVERPGTYTALPAEAEAMYAPILRGNSDDRIITIQIPASVTEAARKAQTQAQTPAAPGIGAGDETAREAYDMAFRASIGWIEELDRNLAFRWMKKAADGGYLPALVTLGSWTKDRKDIPDHEQEAIALYRQALPKLQAQADSTDPEIQVALGRLYLQEEKTAKAIGLGELSFTKRTETGMAHMKKAMELFQKAADQGSGYAAYRLGHMYLGQGIHYSPQMALEYFEKGAETGYAPCLASAASLLPPDTDKREQYLEQAAKGKMVPAAEILAFMHFSKRDDKGNPDKDAIHKGLPYLHQAAEGGAVDAQLCLSELYRKGDYVSKDEDKAAFWAEKAKDGHAESLWQTRLTPDANPLLNALYAKDKPEEGAIPIKSILPPAPVPDTLPERSGRMDGLTDGELLDAWKKGNLQAFAELGIRPLCTGIIDTTPITKEDYIRKNNLAREGDTLTAYELALLLQKSPFTVDKELGMEWLRLLTRMGHSQATLALVSHLRERHPEEALAMLIPLAERNSMAALGILENVFGKSGMGTELNPVRALAYKAQGESLYNIKDILALLKRDQKNLESSHVSTFLRDLERDTQETRTAQEDKALKAFIKQWETTAKSREKKK